MKNRPAYAIASVDRALHLAQLLRQEGPLHLAEAAERLGVARSTAHRLLAMLVYRGFAEQDDDRRYVAGALLGPAAINPEPVSLLRSAALPHLKALVDDVRETANLVIRVGDEVRFIASVECDRSLRVGDRSGQTLPAHLASGGKALLATLPDDEVDRLLARPLAVDERHALIRELRLVRRRGFAVNDQRTESGVTALAMAVRGGSGAPRAAISLALPTVRFSPARMLHLAERLAVVARAAERDIDAVAPSLAGGCGDGEHPLSFRVQGPPRD
ncbi:IclR family transcriptional regulator [Streptomyces sp. NBC_01622]|uniref:IclR family transcriptional regulator n=1 Tax=Streptomyces sp. NBC_01622 TaxID=2975903 RepID=UPI003864CD31|nr:IclR family transcriptional regulator [Streptomyces sp. NBC_01622]